MRLNDYKYNEWLTKEEHVAHGVKVFTEWLEKARRFMPDDLAEYGELAARLATEPKHLNVLVDVIAAAYRGYYEQKESKQHEPQHADL